MLTGKQTDTCENITFLAEVTMF